MLLRGNLGGGRLRRVENGFQGPQIAVTHDLVEALLSSEEGRGHPAAGGPLISPEESLEPREAVPRSSQSYRDERAGGRVAGCPRSGFSDLGNNQSLSTFCRK